VKTPEQEKNSYEEFIKLQKYYSSTARQIAMQIAEVKNPNLVHYKKRVKRIIFGWKKVIVEFWCGQDMGPVKVRFPKSYLWNQNWIDSFKKALEKEYQRKWKKKEVRDTSDQKAEIIIAEKESK